jgi:SRSO17 transposase
MPAEIVTQTRWVEPVESGPAPECHLSEEDIERFLEELTNYMERFAPAFQRVEQLKRSTAYVRGLLGKATRKNAEQMALGLGEKVRSLQYFVGQSPWEVEPAIGVHQQMVGDNIG